VLVHCMSGSVLSCGIVCCDVRDSLNSSPERKANRAWHGSRSSATIARLSESMMENISRDRGFIRMRSSDHSSTI
jgi:hypothetical protein